MDASAIGGLFALLVFFHYVACLLPVAVWFAR